jgi:hypothetical protein
MPFRLAVDTSIAIDDDGNIVCANADGVFVVAAKLNRGANVWHVPLVCQRMSKLRVICTNLYYGCIGATPKRYAFAAQSCYYIRIAAHPCFVQELETLDAECAVLEECGTENECSSVDGAADLTTHSNSGITHIC